MSPSKILPYLTEKSVALAKKGQFTFLVDKTDSSAEIEESIKKLYNVHPVAVSFVKNPPKRKGTGRRVRMRAPRIKAIVSLKKGETIADFIVEEKKEKK